MSKAKIKDVRLHKIGPSKMELAMAVAFRRAPVPTLIRASAYNMRGVLVALRVLPGRWVPRERLDKLVSEGV